MCPSPPEIEESGPLQSPLHSAPDETEGTSRRLLLKKLGVIILVFLLILGAGEIFTRIYDALTHPLLSHSDELDLKYSLVKVPGKRMKKHPGIVFLGDSLVRRGIYTELLVSELQQKGMDIPALNLGVGGANLEENRFLLKTLVDSGVRPKLVVIGLSHRRLRSPLWGGERMSKLFHSSYMGRCMAYPSTGWDARFDCKLADVSHLYRNRTVLRDTLSHFPQLLADSGEKLGAYPLERGGMSRSGWMPGYERANVPTAIKKYWKRKARKAVSAEASIRPTYSTIQLEKLVSYCKKQNLPVLLIWMPHHPATYELYDAYEKDLVNRMPGETQVLAKKWDVPFENFETWDTNILHYEDLGHFNVEGAILFTRHLTDIIGHLPYKQSLLSSSQPSRPQEAH